MTVPDGSTSKPSDCLLWLLDVVTQTKELIVDEQGIGADVPPLVAAFDANDNPIGYAQAATMEPDRRQQFIRLTQVAAMMRSGWHAYSLAMVLETYINLGGDDNGTTLAERFACNDKDVVEAISIVWASQDGRRSILSLPYAVGLGRRVAWKHDLKELVVDGHFDGIYPSALNSILSKVGFLSRHPALQDSHYVTEMASEIANEGFYVFFDGE